MNKMKLRLLCTMIHCLIVVSIQAQVPNLMNYQGVALNSNGSPISNDTIKLKVRIRTGSPTGTAEYYEERSVVTDATGLFSFQIDGPGKIIGAGTLSSVNWSSGDKFLQIEMDPNNGNTFTDLGTQQLVTVPYAKVAEKFGLPYTTVDPANTETFKISNTNANGKAIVAVANGSNATALQANASSTATALQAAHSGNGVAMKASNVGTSSTTTAIEAINTGSLGTAIKATANNSNQVAITAISNSGTAIKAEATNSLAVAVDATSTNGWAVWGKSVNSRGVVGVSTNIEGVYGGSTNGTGVSGESSNSFGVVGLSTHGVGVYAQCNNPAGLALKTSGNTELNGNLKIYGGNTSPGNGAVLTSDAAGNAMWKKDNIGFIASYNINLNVYLAGGVLSTPPLVDSYDPSNSFNNSSSATDPNTFIAPVSGLYSFSAYVSIYGGIVYDFTYMNVTLFVNGISSFNHNTFGLTDANSAAVDFNQRIHLNAGDKVTLRVKHDKTVSTTSLLVSVEFSGELVFAD